MPAGLLATSQFRIVTLRYISSTSTRAMPSNNQEAKNATGLTPAETQSLKERKPEAHEEAILSGIKQVFHTFML